MKANTVVEFDARLLNATFNDAYDRVVIPYDRYMINFLQNSMMGT